MLTPKTPCSHPGCPHPAVKEWVWEPDDQVYLCEEHEEYYNAKVDEVIDNNTKSEVVNGRRPD